MFVTLSLSPLLSSIHRRTTFFTTTITTTITHQHHHQNFNAIDQALLVLPKTLAVNAAKDATELVAKLRAFHHTAQVGLDQIRSD